MRVPVCVSIIMLILYGFLPVVGAANEDFDIADDLGTLTEGGTLRANDYDIVPPTDVDTLKFQVACRMMVTIETSGPSGGDTVIELYDSSYTLIERDDDGGVGYYSKIQRELPAGLYYVKVFEYGQNDEIYNYDVVITGGTCVDDTRERIVAWIPYSDQDQEWAHTREALNRAGLGTITVTSTDRSSLERALAGASCLLIPEQEEADEDELEDLGYEVRWVLRDFLAEGGTIVAMTFARGGDDILRGARIVDVYDAENITDETVYVSSPSDPLVRGISRSFTARDGSTDFSGVSPEAQVVVEDAEGDPVVFWQQIDQGLIIMIGFDFYEYNDAMAVVLANALGGGSPQECPGAVTVSSLGSIPGRLSASTTMAPGDLDFWFFQVTRRTYVRIETIISEGDTVIYLYDQDWELIEADDDGGTNMGSRIDRSLAPGTYYVLVLDFGTPEEYSYTYTIEIEG